MLNSAVIFDIAGPFGLFRKPYAAVCPISYPCPPPTAVLGMVGAIVGYGKGEYLKILGTDEVSVAVRMLKPARKFRVGVNHIATKGNRDFRLKLPNPRTQVPCEFLRDCAFRIVFSHRNPQVLNDLQAMLESGKTAYTPSLGLASCIADVQYRGIHTVEQNASGEHEFSYILPADAVSDIRGPESGGRVERFMVPTRLEPGRKDPSYREVIAETEARALTARAEESFVCNGENVIFL